MEQSLLEVIANLGLGAIFAIVMFIIYRSDRKSSEDRMSKMIENEQKTREENTKALTELKTWLEKRNDKK